VVWLRFMVCSTCYHPRKWIKELVHFPPHFLPHEMWPLASLAQLCFLCYNCSSISPFFSFIKLSLSSNCVWSTEKVRLKQKRANLSLGESTLFYKVSPFLGRKSKDHDIHAQVGLEREIASGIRWERFMMLIWVLCVYLFRLCSPTPTPCLGKIF
jgi:hypothetical protein